MRQPTGALALLRLLAYQSVFVLTYLFLHVLHGLISYFSRSGPPRKIVKMWSLSSSSRLLFLLNRRA